MALTLKTVSYGDNDPSRSTILLIHGAFTSHASFIPIARLLEARGYHVLLPDLPAHGSGSSGLIQPFRMSTCVSHLAELIRDKAHNRKAHLVGFSLGAYIALSLAAYHKDLVDRVFCSGAGRDSNRSSAMQNVVAGVMYTMSNAPAFAKTWFNNKHQLVEPPELVEDDLRWSDRKTLALHQDVDAGLCEFSASNVLDQVKSPVLLISASAHDTVEGQKVWKERLLKSGSPEVKAMKLEGYPHAWCWRDEGLFADGVIAWIQDQPLAATFIEIV